MSRKTRALVTAPSYQDTLWVGVVHRVGKPRMEERLGLYSVAKTGTILTETRMCSNIVRITFIISHIYFFLKFCPCLCVFAVPKETQGGRCVPRSWTCWELGAAPCESWELNSDPLRGINNEPSLPLPQLLALHSKILSQ